MTDAVGPFAHLHVHSHFSLLDGNGRVPALVQAAADDGMPALALTDHGNLFGVVELFSAGRKAGVNPIPGMEAWVARIDRRQQTGDEAGNFSDHLTLLARSFAGYQNLVQLSSRGYTEGQHHHPRIDRELIDQYHQDLFFLSGCRDGQVSRLLLQGNEEEAVRTVCEYQDLVGKENYFLEVMDQGLDDQKALRAALKRVSERTGAPLVATNDVHYLHPDDALAQEVQMRIGLGRTLDSSQELLLGSDQFHFRTRAEMYRLFADMPDAVARTAELAAACNVELPLGERHLPDFETPDGSSSSDYFRRLCMEGIHRHYGDPPPKEVSERLEYEIGVIEQMGFVSYFLITWDFIHYSREHGIPVGPGRGSAAGSIVAYALGITNVCPMKYDLLFERFLNSSRISMPDIDIDFCRDGREQVIHYVRDKYGEDRVSQIVTFGTLAARACIRDAGRVLGVDLREVDRIAKKIPGAPGTKLADALEDPELEAIREENDLHRRLFEVALKLEGLNRHTSTHAAGVVVGDQPLLQIVPLCTVQGEINTQFSMNELEALGLLKMDFLGLKTLTILDICAKMVKQNRGIDIDYEALPLDDEPTFRLLQKGETSAVFQLESGGMRELLIKMHPDVFEDIIAILALYRPGPLGSGMVDSFVNRKKGIEEIAYPHPALEPILAETRGILVYQEQVMRITNILSGFTLNEADSLRKAMGKKKPEVMAEFREKFINGAVERDCKAEVATEIWETMEYFAGYGFNKSHSTAYGLITYWTAWAKANHPSEFMAAVMTCDVANSDKVAAYIQECRRMGIEIQPPDLTASELGCTTDGGAIRLGLSTVKGLGEKAIESLKESLRAAGADASLSAILEGANLAAVNRGALEALIKAGAMDGMGPNRRSLCSHLDALLKEANDAQRDKRAGQASLFGGAPTRDAMRIPEHPEWPMRDVLRAEKEVFGFYLSSNPLARYSTLLRRHCTAAVEDLARMEDGSTVTVAGLAGKPRITTAKRGKMAGRKMAILDLLGVAGQVSCVVFPETFEATRQWLDEDRMLLVGGQLDLSRDEPSLKVSEVQSLENLLFESRAGQLVLELPRDRAEFDLSVDAIQKAIGPHRGKNPLFLQVPRETGAPAVHRVGEQHFVRITEELLGDLEAILGPERVSLR